MTLPPDGGPMTVEAVRDLRITLAATGYSIIPEITGGKFVPKPYSGWRDRAEPFDPAETYSTKHGPLLNTALRLTGTVALDLDVDDGEDVAEIMAIIAEHLGPSPCTRYRANSARKAMLYRTDDTAGFQDAWKGTFGMLEVFAGPNTKLTAFGVHEHKITGVRSRLCWQDTPGNVPLAALPLVSRAQVTECLQLASSVLGESISEHHRIPGSAQPATGNLVAADLDELARASSHIPNDGADWHSWNRMGMALYGASDGHAIGLKAFEQWSRKSTHSRHRDCLTRWMDYSKSPPTTLGANTIFGMAYKMGYRKPVAQMVADKIVWGRQQAQNRRKANFKPTI